MKLSTWLERLLKQADNVQQNLTWLLSGFTSCMLGLLLIIMAEYLFGQSLTQELVALLGLGLVGLGVLVAAAGYIGLSLLRIVRFLMKDKDKQP